LEVEPTGQRGRKWRKQHRGRRLRHVRSIRQATAPSDCRPRRYIVSPDDALYKSTSHRRGFISARRTHDVKSSARVWLQHSGLLQAVSRDAINIGCVHYGGELLHTPLTRSPRRVYISYCSFFPMSMQPAATCYTMYKLIIIHRVSGQFSFCLGQEIG